MQPGASIARLAQEHGVNANMVHDWRKLYRQFPAMCLSSTAGAGGLIKVLWWDGDGLCLFAKRLERGHFVFASAR